MDKKQEAENEYKKAEELENKGEFFTASFYYKNSLKAYRELGDSEKQKVCKRKLIETNKKAVNEFHKFEFKYEIPKEKMEKEMEKLNEMMDGNLSEILDKMGRCASLNPRIKDVEKIANKSMPLFAMIATNSTFDDKGNIIKGSDDGRYSWKMTIYEISQGLATDLYIKTLFNALIVSGKLNATDLIS